MINIYEPYITKKELFSVTKSILNSNLSGMSSPVAEFEESFSNVFGFKYCLATNSGTAALHLALIASGIKEGDEVIVPSTTFISTANAVSYVGADPIIVDIDRDTYQISIDEIQKNITKKTSAIIPVHLYGNCPDLDLISEIANLNNLRIVHDSAEALGTNYKKKPSGFSGDSAIYSFYPNKIITTGEGGMLATNNKNIYNIAKMYRGQGLNIDTDEYKHDVVGYNYRMPSLSASFGIAQLKNFDKLLDKKISIHKKYRDLFFNSKVEFMKTTDGVENSFWLTVLDFKNFNIQIDDLRKYLRQNMIETKKVFYPIELQKAYPSNRSNKNALNLYENALCIPSHPKLKSKDLDFISKKILNYLKNKK